MPLYFTSRGGFRHLETWLARMNDLDLLVIPILGKYAEIGRQALFEATPWYTGLAASSWTYDVYSSRRGYQIIWSNTDIEDGFAVAVMLVQGYATEGGGYVAGYDYISPALEPVFIGISKEVWASVTADDVSVFE